MKHSQALTEALAKRLFEGNPASRGAQSWDDQKEEGAYKRHFRQEALEILELIEDFQ